MERFQLRDFLRHATRASHERIDRIFSSFALANDAGLVRFLAAQAGALRPIEAALEAGPNGGIGRLVEDWADRRRAHLIYGLHIGVPELPGPSFRNAQQMLGAAYVLEGSKIGARVLLRRIEHRSSDIGRCAVRFLSHAAGGERWASFLACLNQHCDRERRFESLAGALTAFALFERSAVEVAARPDRLGRSNPARAAVDLPTILPGKTRAQSRGGQGRAEPEPR